LPSFPADPSATQKTAHQRHLYADEGYLYEIQADIPSNPNFCTAAVQALLKYFRTVSGQELMPGIVAVIQTFGDRINFHPHLHILVTEGGTDPDKHFHNISRFHDDLIQDLFTREVFSLLLQEKLISLSMVQKILSWHQRVSMCTVKSGLKPRERQRESALHDKAAALSRTALL